VVISRWVGAAVPCGTGCDSTHPWSRLVHLALQPGNAQAPRDVERTGPGGFTRTHEGRQTREGSGTGIVRRGPPVDAWALRPGFLEFPHLNASILLEMPFPSSASPPLGVSLHRLALPRHHLVSVADSPAHPRLSVELRVLWLSLRSQWSHPRVGTGASAAEGGTSGGDGGAVPLG